MLAILKHIITYFKLYFQNADLNFRKIQKDKLIRQATDAAKVSALAPERILKFISCELPESTTL